MRDVIIQLVRVLFKNMTGKYAKLTLERLEQQNLMSKEVRKVVLDGYNELNREVERRLDLMLQ